MYKLFVLLRMYLKRKNMKLKLSKEYSQRKSDNYTAIIVFATTLIILFNTFSPKAIVDADIYKSMTSVFINPTLPDVYESVLDKDLQKQIDLFKSHPKYSYEIKNLTTQLTIWQFLTVNMHFSDIQAAGIYGNMMVESGSRTFNVRPYIYSPGNAYYGLCQWNTSGHHSRINGGSLSEQLEYLQDTIESEMGYTNYQRFLNAETPEQASIIFGQWYERCASPDSRQNEARRAYERFGGN